MAGVMNYCKNDACRAWVLDEDNRLYSGYCQDCFGKFSGTNQKGTEDMAPRKTAAKKKTTNTNKTTQPATLSYTIEFLTDDYYTIGWTHAHLGLPYAPDSITSNFIDSSSFSAGYGARERETDVETITEYLDCLITYGKIKILRKDN